jgi:integrase
MRMGNGNGSVYKMKGKRRKPWRAIVTLSFEYDEKKQKFVQKRRVIGNYPTQKEALDALTEYRKNPYDIDTNKITFAEVYDRWSNVHFETIVPSATRTWKSAFQYFKQIHSMRFIDVRPNHIEGCIKNADVGNSTKQRMKSLCNMMYRYALKNEIVSVNYADLCDTIKRGKPTIVRVPFSSEEEKMLWDNISFPFVDMVLIGLYSGWRPQELAILKIADIDLENHTFTGGLKTDAGRNRTIPIHSKIYDLVKKNYEKAISMNSEYLFNDEDGQQGTFFTYDKYRGRFGKINKKLHLSHRPHDTRHTFITKAKAAGVDEYILKAIVGHEIVDVTEKVYTHRTMEEFKREIEKIP